MLSLPEKFPTEILYPTDYYPVASHEQQAIIDEYVRVLEDILGVKKTEFSIAERWRQDLPPEAHGKSIQAYIETVRSFSTL